MATLFICGHPLNGTPVDPSSDEMRPHVFLLYRMARDISFAPETSRILMPHPGSGAGQNERVEFGLCDHNDDPDFEDLPTDTRILVGHIIDLKNWNSVLELLSEGWEFMTKEDLQRNFPYIAEKTSFF